MGTGVKLHHGAIRGLKIYLTFTRHNQLVPTCGKLSQYPKSFSGITIRELQYTNSVS